MVLSPRPSVYIEQPPRQDSYPWLNISPDATARKEKGSTEADDAARFSGETFYLSIKCFIL